MKDDLPVIPFATPSEFVAWLDEHHATADGVWIKMAKKASGIPSVTAPEALDAALCFGWIDGLRRGLDDTWFLQRYTPRRRRSKWSQVNVGKVEELIGQGRMRPAGLAEVERAKADGRWDAAYAPQSRIGVPPDLQRELDADPDANAFFESLDRRNRFAILYRLEDAKKPETRARRLGTFVAMLKRREKLLP
jgi:uncharacterized protein YdeI (YjbR/CyaY-like superfamily)